MLDVEAPMAELAEGEGIGRASALADEAYLYRRSPGAEPGRWALSTQAGVVTIGRSASADVCVVNDPQVSRLHATLEPIGGQWMLLDDGLSVNGTYVNGRRVSGRVRLRDRDTIRVGSALFVFCAPEPATDLPTVAGGEIPPVRRLTEPQRRVLAALCRPYGDGRPYPTPASNLEITRELTLSLDAVKTHLRVLYHKFGIEDLPQNQKRARLAELALQLGLLSNEPFS
jgi:pSer/pThr/pTyr-binding forkhead associated (FHA) protein